MSDFMEVDEQAYEAAMRRQFEARSRDPLLTDSVSRQIIARLDEIASLIPQHRFYRTDQFARPTLDGLLSIAQSGVRSSGDVGVVCDFVTNALSELQGDMDGPAAGRG
jgi:hypothetical protein